MAEKKATERPSLDGGESFKVQLNLQEDLRKRYAACRLKLEKATGVPMTDAYFARVLVIKGLETIEATK